VHILCFCLLPPSFHFYLSCYISSSHLSQRPFTFIYLLAFRNVLNPLAFNIIFEMSTRAFKEPDHNCDMCRFFHPWECVKGKGKGHFVRVYSTLRPWSELLHSPLEAPHTNRHERCLLANSQFPKELGSFTCPKAGTWDRLFYFPFEGRHALGFGRKRTHDLGYQRPAC
jgi:hypothetical protein